MHNGSWGRGGSGAHEEGDYARYVLACHVMHICETSSGCWYYVAFVKFCYVKFWLVPGSFHGVNVIG